MRYIHKIKCMRVLPCSIPHTLIMEIDWRDQIRTTESMSKHQRVVENILRDKEDGWRHDYYKETTTGYDLHVGRAQHDINRYTMQSKKYELLLENTTRKLEASKKEIKDSGVKKLTQREIDALEAEYIDVYKLKCEQLVLLDGAKKSLQEFAWKQYVQKKRFILLQWLRNNFMLTGDVDYMARGVTWVEEYIASLQEKIV